MSIEPWRSPEIWISIREGSATRDEFPAQVVWSLELIFVDLIGSSDGARAKVESSLGEAGIVILI